MEDRGKLVKDLEIIWRDFVHINTMKNPDYPKGGVKDTEGVLAYVPECSEVDLDEFQAAIRTCQRIIATQHLKSIAPDFFNAIKDEIFSTNS